MKLKLLFLLVCLNSAYQLNCMSRKTSFTVGATATVLGVGSLAWQLYTQDYSLKKSLITGTFLGSGLACFLYNKYASFFPFSNYSNKIDEESLEELMAEHDENYNEKKEIDLKECHDQRNISILILDSDFNKIKRRLDAGSLSPNAKLYQANILYYAMIWGKLNIFKLLIEYGANVSVEDLAYSITIEQADYFNLIMSQRQKSNLNILDYYDYASGTLLHQAAKFGSVYKLEKLIESGALECLNAQDRFGYTPLCYALKYHRIDAVKYLIKCGAQLDVVTATGQSLTNIAQGEGISLQGIKKDILYEQSFMPVEEKPETYIRALPPELQDHVLNFVVNN